VFDVMAGVSEDSGFGGLGGDMLTDLIVARVVEPMLLLDMDRVAVETGRQWVCCRLGADGVHWLCQKCGST
jgi:hypothetical protein